MNNLPPIQMDVDPAIVETDINGPLNRHHEFVTRVMVDVGFTSRHELKVNEFGISSFIPFRLDGVFSLAAIGWVLEVSLCDEFSQIELEARTLVRFSDERV